MTRADAAAFSRRRNPIHDELADSFQNVPDAVEQWHEGAQSENADGRQTIRRGEREHFRDEVAEQNDDGKDGDGCEPLRHILACGRTFPEQKQAQDDQRHVHDGVAQEQDVEDAPRIIAEGLNEILQRGMLILEPTKLVRLEREERRLQPGEKRGEKNESRDNRQENDEAGRGHSAPRRRSRPQSRGGKIKRAGLPLISDGSKLRLT